MPRASSATRSSTELEDSASPGAGACGGQFTANTMAMAFEVLGISPAGSSMVPAEDGRKGQVAEDCGRLILDVLERDLRPSQIITRDALENAIAAGAMSGGSTNLVLHLLAVAHEAGVPLTIDDFDEIAWKTPLLCDLKPGGRYVATDLYAAGGVPLVIDRLRAAGLLHEDAITVTARRSARSADGCAGDRGPGRRALRSTSRSSPTAASPSCAATSRPRAAWSSSPATTAASIAARRACSRPRRTPSPP